jgi:Pectinesterase.
VTVTTDGNAVNQLRGAVAAAEAAGPGPHTIHLAAGTYDLTMGQISFGDNPITIHFVGEGADNTIINMTTSFRDRIFRINPTATVPDVKVSFDGIRFQNGLVTSDYYGGGAILCGGPSNEITITNCVFEKTQFKVH